MLPELKRELDALSASQPTREMRVLSGRGLGRIQYQNRTFLDFTSWDYLNLAQHERVKRAAQEEIELHGTAASSARISSGTFPAHRACEHRLAQFLGVESTLLLSSKNQAYFSLLTGVCSERDVVIADEQLQAPVADAAFLVNASFASFPSGNLNALATELERHKPARRKLVLMESLTTHSGELSALARAIELTEKHGAHLVLDESAALGAIGPRGAGGFDAERVALSGKLFCQISELSSLAGAPLALIAGPAVLISTIIQRSRTFGAEPAVPPTICASITIAADLAEVMLGARSELAETARLLRSRINQIVGGSSEISDSPIITVPCPTVTKCRELAMALFGKGILVDVLQTKGLLSESAVIRLIVNSGHDDADIDRVILACSEIVAKVLKD